MLGDILWAVRLLLVFVILKMVLAPFLKKAPLFSGKSQDKVKRFKADDAKVEDADFKEL
jgi:hypothetical protein